MKRRYKLRDERNEGAMNVMKTCPICFAKAARGARTCYECYYRFSDQSTRNVSQSLLNPNLAKASSFTGEEERARSLRSEMFASL